MSVKILDGKFAGEKVALVKTNEHGYAIFCKKVIILVEDFLKWEETPVQNTKIGFGLNNLKDAKIIERHGIIKISCLSDSRENVNKLKREIKQVINDEEKRTSSKKG